MTAENLVVAIDPGHGGRTGCRTRDESLWEDDYVLAQALELRTLIQLAQWPVTPVLLRYGPDVCPSHAQREASAQAAGYHLLISLHCDSVVQEYAHGGRAFFWPGNEIGEAVAHVIADAYPDEIGAIATPADLGWSRVRNVLGAHEHTAVLLEQGFLSNAHDSEQLQRESIKAGIQLAVLAGVARFWHVFEASRLRAA